MFIKRNIDLTYEMFLKYNDRSAKSLFIQSSRFIRKEKFDEYIVVQFFNKSCYHCSKSQLVESVITRECYILNPEEAINWDWKTISKELSTRIVGWTIPV